MAKGIEPTEPLEGEDAERFLEYMNRPLTEEDRKFARECKRIYKSMRKNSEF